LFTGVLGYFVAEKFCNTICLVKEETRRIFTGVLQKKQWKENQYVMFVTIIVLLTRSKGFRLPLLILFVRIAVNLLSKHVSRTK
jgi:hypothetical protein